jgi:hypothetical protein
MLASAAQDVRDSVRRARARGRAHRRPDPERASADEVKRRLDETRERLRREIPPREE